MELNREQIINDLGCFKNRILHSKLAEQVYGKEMMSIIDAMALINELSGECQKWQESYDCADSACRELSGECNRLTEENERLRLAFVAECNLSNCTREKEIKADTARKMQEKILAKSEYGTINISPWQLEQIVREILEENK